MAYYQTTRSGLKAQIKTASASLLEARTPGLKEWAGFLAMTSPTMGDFRSISDRQIRADALSKAISRAEQAQARLNDGSFSWNVEALGNDGAINFVVFARQAGLSASFVKVSGKLNVRLAYSSAEFRQKMADALQDARNENSAIVAEFEIVKATKELAAV